MVVGKSYNLHQLRGAFAAGRKSRETPAPNMIDSSRIKKAADFMERQLLDLAEQYGIPWAYTRARRNSEWVCCLISNLFNAYGTEVEAEAIFDRVIKRLDATGMYSEIQIAAAEHALERWLQETIARAIAAREAGYRRAGYLGWPPEDEP